MDTYSREGLHRMYLRSVHEKKVEKILELLSLCKKTILERNLDGNTQCTIHLEPFLDEEILQNLICRLRQQFKDLDFTLFGNDRINGLNGLEVDWTISLPTYVVNEKDHVVD